MYGIKAFVNGVEDGQFKDVRLPLIAAKMVCGLAFAEIVANIRKESLDEVIITETDYSCHARCVETGIEFEFRIEEVGA